MRVDRGLSSTCAQSGEGRTNPAGCGRLSRRAYDPFLRLASIGTHSWPFAYSRETQGWVACRYSGKIRGFAGSVLLPHSQTGSYPPPALAWPPPSVHQRFVWWGGVNAPRSRASTLRNSNHRSSAQFGGA